MNEQAMNEAIAEAKAEVKSAMALVTQFRAENNAIIEGLKNAQASIRLPNNDYLYRMSEKTQLETALEKISTENPVTILPSRENVKKRTEKFADNVAKLECLVVLSDDEKKYMPKHQREAFERAEQERLAGPTARTDIPSCFLSQASMKNGPVEMEIITR